MPKVLVRSGMSPLDNFDAAYMMANNAIGGNVGNLIYQYSVYRALMTQGATVEADHYCVDQARSDVLIDKLAGDINEQYDCYVIPLADAFRDSFVRVLKNYTRLIKQLNIPVAVVGAGLRAPYEPDLDNGFPFDEDVKAFVNAVLDKSAMLGLRGQITHDYLCKLGFASERHHTVIGCPSMYAFGSDLGIRHTEITPASSVSLNASLKAPTNATRLIAACMHEFQDYTFIPQWMKEMRLAYLGHPSLLLQPQQGYPTRMSDPAYMTGRVAYFLSAIQWVEFMKTVDVSIGARMHGTITATIAGTPAIIMPIDARTRELTAYHNLTSFPAHEIQEDTSIWDVLNAVDFQSPVKGHSSRFKHFVDFLDANGLDHIYKDTGTPADVPLDQQAGALNFNNAITPISQISLDDMVARWEHYEHELQQSKARKEQINAEIKQLKEEKKEKQAHPPPLSLNPIQEWAQN